MFCTSCENENEIVFDLIRFDLIWVAELVEQFQVQNLFKTRKSTNFCFIEEKYGSVSYSFSCMKVMFRHPWIANSRMSSIFKNKKHFFLITFCLLQIKDIMWIIILHISHLAQMVNPPSNINIMSSAYILRYIYIIKRPGLCIYLFTSHVLW